MGSGKIYIMLGDLNGFEISLSINRGIIFWVFEELFVRICLVCEFYIVGVL